MTDRGLRYMPALDGLRALAVIGVMLFHFNVSWAKGGYFGVDAFFVLSGFLITSLLLQERRAAGRIDLKSFWVRRARRLLPALALVLAAVALYASHYATPVELHQLRTDGLSTIFYVANWNQVFSHVSYFQQFAAPSMLHHTWSLAIEEQFYVLWPLVIFFAVRRGRLGRGGLIGLTAGLAAASALLMAVLYHPGHDPSRVYYGTDTHAQSLLIGAVLAMLLLDRPVTLKQPHRMALHGGAIAAVIALGFIWTLTTNTSDWQYRGGFAIAAILVCIIVASVTQPGDPGPVGWVMSRAPLRAIGIISYGVYLWHFPVYVFLNEDRTGLDGAALVFVRIAATFVIAAASFFLIERPVRYGALRGWQVRVVTPLAGAAIASLVVVSTAGAIPVELQSISSKQLVPPPAARPQAAGAPQPLRFMLVGDSVAASLATGLKSEGAKRGQLFWSAAIPGCGLATDAGDRWVGTWIGPDPNCLPTWRTRWPQQVKQFHPNVVVVLLGAQDTFDRRINGTVTKFDTTAGTALAKKDLTDTVTALTKTGAHVVFLTTPYYVQGWPMQIDAPRSLFNPTWINRWNAIQRDVVQHSGGRASILDLNKLIDPNGVWTDTVNGIKVRLFDKMHLSKDGAAFVGKWLTPQLPRYLPAIIGRRAS